MEKNIDGKLIVLKSNKTLKMNNTSLVSKNADSKRKATKQYKQKYFDYYDDVKDRTHKVVDW